MGGCSLWKWPNFRLSRAHDLDLGSGHTAYRRATIFDLYLHTKFHRNRTNFLWTDWHLRPTLYRSTQRSRPNNSMAQEKCQSKQKNRFTFSDPLMHHWLKTTEYLCIMFHTYTQYWKSTEHRESTSHIWTINGKNWPVLTCNGNRGIALKWQISLGGLHLER